MYGFFIFSQNEEVHLKHFKKIMNTKWKQAILSKEKVFIIK